MTCCTSTLSAAMVAETAASLSAATAARVNCALASNSAQISRVLLASPGIGVFIGRIPWRSRVAAGRCLCTVSSSRRRREAMLRSGRHRHPVGLPATWDGLARHKVGAKQCRQLDADRRADYINDLKVSY